VADNHQRVEESCFVVAPRRHTRGRFTLVAGVYEVVCVGPDALVALGPKPDKRGLSSAPSTIYVCVYRPTCR
jgi:hypothetical protein